MRRMILPMVIALAALSGAAFAQTRAQDTVPAVVLQDAAALYNARSTIRVRGTLDVAADRTIDGDVAVIEGPTLTLAGRIAGRLLAINIAVVLRPGARIDGDLTVIGGRVEGLDGALVAGPVRVFRQSLEYHFEAGQLVIDSHRADDPTRFSRLFQLGAQTASGFALSAGTYNRTEGLALSVGPELFQRIGRLEARVDALGIIRSVDEFNWTSENIGHRATAEVRAGDDRGLVLIASLYDIVEPVERWQLKNTEVALATFFLHRDFRDYFDRHGGEIALRAFRGTAGELTVGFRDERWGARAAGDPFTLFRDTQGWRPNPDVDVGPMHVATAAYRFDTRNDADNPWTGWLLATDLERGSGSLTSPEVGVVAQRVRYTRGFADLRRYNRLSPFAQLNFRVVLGGRIGGGPLPLQRRLSIGGAGTLPGFDFRRNPGGPDVGTCAAGSAIPGSPALCERVALAQIEYRGSFGFGGLASAGRFGEWLRKYEARFPQWVLFADAGRGWLVGPGGDGLHYRSSTILPPGSTFRSDVGLGLDARDIGFFVAKSVSDKGEPANFFVRVRHRF